MSICIDLKPSLRELFGTTRHALALPLTTTEAVTTGMLLSFLVYAGVVIWVFAARSATRAWAGLLLAALPLLLAAVRVWSGSP